MDSHGNSTHDAMEPTAATQAGSVTAIQHDTRSTNQTLGRKAATLVDGGNTASTDTTTPIGHGQPPPGSSAVVCALCRKWFGNTSALRLHYRTDEHVAMVQMLWDALETDYPPDVSAPGCHFLLCVCVRACAMNTLRRLSLPPFKCCP